VGEKTVLKSPTRGVSIVGSRSAEISFRKSSQRIMVRGIKTGDMKGVRGDSDLQLKEPARNLRQY
jgi:hypothetical protein